MTSLLEGARRILSRRSDLDGRVVGLDDAVQAADGRLEQPDVDAARAVVTRASARLRLSADHTVVALAGATGSGKSSTFNALAGLDLAAVGVRRPTTSWATACIWGQKGAAELLEWLGIPLRHQVVRDSMLDTGREPSDLQGLVLLDLPDHDSTEVGHHLEVDRLVELADLMVWVLDPQKYADAAIHDRFLRPLAQHREVMLVVVNHIDEVAPERRDGMMADVRRLLDADGLSSVPLIAISARTGIGIDQLRSEIGSRVADKAATRTRIGTDVTMAAERLRDASGSAPVPAFGKAQRGALADAVIDAAAVPAVVDAVRVSAARRARRATGWPVTSWVSRLRPDPLKRMNIDLSPSQKHAVRSARTTAPAPSPVHRARVDTCVRELADSVSKDLTPPWAHAVRRASVSRTDDLASRLDRAMSATELGVAHLPLWCRFVRVVQWLLLLVAVGGGVWLVAQAVMRQVMTSPPATPTYAGVRLPAGLLVGGVVLGVALGLLCWVVIAIGARSRAGRADRRLRAAVQEVTEELVVAPMEAELAAYQRAREGLRRALG